MLIKQVLITKDASLTLTNLPYEAGEEVEVIVLSKRERQHRSGQWKSLFEQTQSLPQIQSLTDEEITTEVEQFRIGG